MKTILLFCLFHVILSRETRDSAPNQSRRLLLHGDQDLLSEFQRLSGLVDRLVKENNETKTLLNQLQKDRASNGGTSTFVRWGRTTCPGNGTELVYAGLVGGSPYNKAGSAANTVCLTRDPIWDHYDAAVGADAKMYGGEYQFYGEPSNAAAYFGKPVLDHDVPCAVCLTSRSSNIMIPGRNKCTDGWTEEYHGYLVAGYYGWASASEYLCLDKNPDVVLGGGKKDDDGRLFYMVEAICGSLACPPYVNGRELTCVVCSK